MHRRILSLIGQKELALEENLNFAHCLKNSSANVQILNVKLFGVVSNWILFGEK
jgi:hypothetical protein